MTTATVDHAIRRSDNNPFLSAKPLRLTLQSMLLPTTLGILGVLYHEWWRDEAYTWLVVGSSRTIGQLFGNLGFNGHPRPYYVLAWMLQHIWKAPLALSLTNLGFCLVAIFLFIRSAPVTRFQAVLFSLGFFPLFQYGIISRSYSLLVFLLFLYCYLRSTRPTAVAARLLVLAALAQVHLISMLAAAGLLAFEWIASSPAVRRRTQNWIAAAILIVSLASSAWQISPDRASLSGKDAKQVLFGLAVSFLPSLDVLNEGGRVRRDLLAGVGLMVFLGTLVLLWLRRNDPIVYGILAGGLVAMCIFVYGVYRWHFALYVLLKEVLSGVAIAFFPNFGVLNESGPVPHNLLVGVGLMLFLASLVSLWSRRNGLIVYGILAGGLVAMCIFVYSGFRWHFGFYYIFMIVALWLSDGSVPDGVRGRLLTIVFSVQAIVGLYAIGSDIVRPYSDGLLAADFLREQHLDHLPMVGLTASQHSKDTTYHWEVDEIQPVLLELGGSKVYDPVGASFESFYTHYASNRYFPPMNTAEAELEIRNLATHIGTPFVVVVVRKPGLTFDVPAPLQKLKDLPEPLEFQAGFSEAYSIFLYSR